MQTQKEATSYRLTPEAKRLLTNLAEKLGLSRGAVLEIAIRDFHVARADPDKSFSGRQKNP